MTHQLKNRIEVTPSISIQKAVLTFLLTQGMPMTTYKYDRLMTISNGLDSGFAPTVLLGQLIDGGYVEFSKAGDANPRSLSITPSGLAWIEGDITLAENILIKVKSALGNVPVTYLAIALPFCTFDIKNRWYKIMFESDGDQSLLRITVPIGKDHEVSRSTMLVSEFEIRPEILVEKINANEGLGQNG